MGQFWCTNFWVPDSPSPRLPILPCAPVHGGIPCHIVPYDLPHVSSDHITRGPQISVYRPAQGVWAATNAPTLSTLLLPNLLMGLRVSVSVAESWVPAPERLPPKLRSTIAPQDPAAAPGPAPKAPAESFLGILDTGATYTVLNWAAARTLGIEKDDPRLSGCPVVFLRGMDGRSKPTPLISARVTLCGFDTPPTPEYSLEGWGLADMTEGVGAPCVEFREVLVGLSDLNFDRLLHLNGRGSYLGPAVLVGQDVLQQQPMVMSGDLGQVAFGGDPPLPLPGQA